jgi:hypothetical protein
MFQLVLEELKTKKIKKKKIVLMKRVMNRNRIPPN